MKNILNKISFKKGSDIYITLCMFLLSFIGILMTTSTSVGDEKNVWNVIKFGGKQVAFLIAGLLMMNFMSQIFKFKKVEKKYFGISIFMILFLCLTMFFKAQNGAKAWIRLPLGMSVQPSEFFKIYVIVLIGVCIEKTRWKKISFKDAFGPLFFFGGIGFFIILFLQKDLGTAVIVLTIATLLIMIPYHPQFTKSQYYLILGVFGLIILMLLLLTNPGLDLIIKTFSKGDATSYKVYRFLAARDPFQDSANAGHQLIFGLEAIARGGLLGSGLGNSVVKFLIPEGRTDYIMAILIEELGLNGFFIVSFLMFVIIGRLVYYAVRAKNESYKVILVGVSLYFSLHYILNVGGISGLIPLTGVPLLLVSAGGTSLIAVFMGIGICQGIIATIKKDLAQTTLKNIEKE